MGLGEGFPGSGFLLGQEEWVLRRKFLEGAHSFPCLELEGLPSFPGRVNTFLLEQV
jgi:hypothetical protein